MMGMVLSSVRTFSHLSLMIPLQALWKAQSRETCPKLSVHKVVTSGDRLAPGAV